MLYTPNLSRRIQLDILKIVMLMINSNIINISYSLASVYSLSTNNHQIIKSRKI